VSSNRFDRTVQDRRDVVETEIVEVIESRNLRLPPRETPDRPPHVHGVRTHLRSGLEMFPKSYQSFRTGECASHKGSGAVGHDPPHPCARVVIAADLSPTAIGGEERVLGQIIGGKATPRQDIRKGRHRVELPLVEVIEIGKGPNDRVAASELHIGVSGDSLFHTSYSFDKRILGYINLRRRATGRIAVDERFRSRTVDRR
jgi:hypothetical protein